MQRSSSARRLGGFFDNPNNPTALNSAASNPNLLAHSKSKKHERRRSASILDGDGGLLPVIDPQSAVGKRLAWRLWVAGNLIHLIPPLLILAALLLWFFSNSIKI